MTTAKPNRSDRRRLEAAHRAAVKTFDASGRLFPGGPFLASMYVVRREDISLVVAHALRGDVQARTVLTPVEEFLSNKCGGSPADPDAPLCLTCEATFGKGALPGAVLVVVPVKIGPVCVCSGVCNLCASRLGNKAISEAWARRMTHPGPRWEEV